MESNMLLVPLDRVVQLTSMSKSTIRRKVDAGTFPRPVQLSERRKAWPMAAVKQWIADIMASAPANVASTT